MIYLVALYGLASAVAVVLDCVQMQFVPAFCVALLSAASIAGGAEAKAFITDGGVMNKFGRLLYAGALLAVAWYLSSRYKVHLHYITFPGLYWLVVGASIGVLSGPGRLPISRARG